MVFPPILTVLGDAALSERYRVDQELITREYSLHRQD